MPAQQAVADGNQERAISLLVERQAWRDRYTGVHGPILLVTGLVFTVVSAAPFVAAKSERDGGDSYSEHAEYLADSKNSGGTTMTEALKNAREKHNHAEQLVRVGAGFAATGVLLFVAGAVLTSLRTSKRKQQREIDRIDGELRRLAVLAHAEPWLNVRGRRAAAGLVATIRF
jgi:hypothetical protein